jgi:hypothetical protein
MLRQIKKIETAKKFIRQLLEVVSLARNVAKTFFIASPSQACEIENTVL